METREELLNDQLHNNSGITDIFDSDVQPPMEEQSLPEENQAETSVGKTIRKVSRKIKSAVVGVTEGTAYAASRFDVRMSGKTAVQVFDTAVKNKKGYSTWLLRFDGPHADHHSFPHINVNKRITGVPDPHVPLTTRQLAAAQQTGKVLEKVNKFALPVAIAIDGARFAYSAHNDYKNGTTRNMVEKTANIAGGWGGGFALGAYGASIGSVVLPGFGTIIGGIVGGLVGGIAGSTGLTTVAEVISDKAEYNIEVRKCKICGEEFKARIYQGEKDEYLCEFCRERLNNCVDCFIRGG